MELSQTQQNELKKLLAERINDGQFKKLVLQDNGDGFECNVDGDLFAIIGAIGQVINEFSNKTGIPVFVLNTYVTLASEMAEQILCYQKEKECTDQEFTQFMDILTGDTGEVQ